MEGGGRRKDVEMGRGKRAGCKQINEKINTREMKRAS